jgi:hypothetical protein
MPGSKVAWRPLPRAFAVYIATSALRRISSAPSMSATLSAIPTLVPTNTSLPSRWNGAR